MRRKGVSTTAWLARLYSNSAFSILLSQRRGELQLMSEIVAGVCSMVSRPPKRISVILIVSRASEPVTTLPM